MKILNQIAQFLIAETYRAVRVYFASMLAAWLVLRHGGGHGSHLMSLYRQHRFL